MRLNENERITGERCVLVPYRASLVSKYHDWMQDEELLQATSSERLTLQEEFAMQESWQKDEDKLTFIILNKSIYEASGDEVYVKSMVGDINAFVNPSEDDEADEKWIELSVMIAEKKARNRGFAKEAVALMILYVNRMMSFTNYIVKINTNNLASIELFKKLHFQQLYFDKIFQCYTLKFDFENFFDALAGNYSLKLEQCA